MNTLGLLLLVCLFFLPNTDLIPSSHSAWEVVRPKNPLHLATCAYWYSTYTSCHYHLLFGLMNCMELRWSVSTPKSMQDKASWINVLSNNIANGKRRWLEREELSKKIGLKGDLRYKAGEAKEYHFSCKSLIVVGEDQKARHFSQPSFCFLLSICMQHIIRSCSWRKWPYTRESRSELNHCAVLGQPIHNRCLVAKLSNRPGSVADMESRLHKSNFPAEIEACREKANSAFINPLLLLFFFSTLSEQFRAISK